LCCCRSINTYVAFSEYVMNVDADVAIHTHTNDVTRRVPLWKQTKVGLLFSDKFTSKST
jgi:hypothetical protein